VNCPPAMRSLEQWPPPLPAPYRFFVILEIALENFPSMVRRRSPPPTSLTDMLKTRFIGSCTALLLAFAVSSGGQTLLLQYNFDDAVSPAADTGATPAAPGTLVVGGSAAGFVPGNTPSGTGSVFSTGDGVNNYLTTGTGIGAENASGDIAKVDTLQAFTLTLWVNLQSISINERFMSDGGAPGALGINGFDFFVGTGTPSASNFSLSLSVDQFVVHSSVSTNALNQWVFLAVTYDGAQTSNNVVFYRGTTSSFAAQLGATQTINQGATGDNALPFQVAGTAQSPGDRTPTGLFDDIRVYSGAGDAAFIESVRLANVPEPSAMAALLGGTALLGLVRRRS
jgi:hypothetical protein